VSLLNEMGVDVGMDFLKKSGIPLHEDDRNLSIALGGFTEGVSPLEMAQAYGMFPNLGTMNEAHAIRKITTSSGKVLLEVKAESVDVMKPENAYTMTQMLTGVVEEGTGRNADLGQRPTAGKTGTTQLPSTEDFQGIDGIRDAWFVGYTPELVTAVWIGYDQLDPEHVIASSGGNHPAKIFYAIMSKALINESISQFAKPKNYKEEGNKKKDKDDDDDDDEGKNNNKDGKKNDDDEED
jgi:penicillin-binding protein 2A